MKYVWKVPLEATVHTAKCPRGKSFMVFTVFHSIANLFLQNMALSIGNISLQNAIVKGLLQIAIFYSKHESFLPWMFSHIQYQIYIYINPNGIR